MAVWEKGMFSWRWLVQSPDNTAESRFHSHVFSAELLSGLLAKEKKTTKQQSQFGLEGAGLKCRIIPAKRCVGCAAH